MFGSHHLTFVRFTRFFLFLILPVALWRDVLADGKKLLVLDDAIAIALEKSYRMKSLRLSLAQAEQNLIAAKGRFRTNAQMSFDTPNWYESVSQIQRPDDLPIYNTTGLINYQGTLNISQPLPTGGALSLVSRGYHQDVSTFRTDLDSTLKRSEILSSVSLRFSQSLFTPNDLRIGLRRANLGFERATKYYRRNELDVVYRVTQSFFDLYQATSEARIAEDNAIQQYELYDLAKKKYQAGLIPEVEALQMEVDLAESKNNLLSAQGALGRAEDAFKQLIGLELSDSVGVQTDLEYQKIEINQDEATKLALANRMEIREGEIDVEIAKINVRETDAKSAIKGELSAFYDLTGVSDPYLPYGSTWKTLWNSSRSDMDRRPHNRGVVFSLTVPLWDWGVNAAEVSSAQANLRSQELDLVEQEKQIVLEVRDAVSQLREAESRYEVLLKNQEVAQRAFDISIERFNNGDITSQELALDRNRLTQAKMSFLSAYIAYRLAIADLKRKTMWDFEKNQSLVRPQVK